MIIVAWNEVLDATDLMVDAAGVDLLIEDWPTSKTIRKQGIFTLMTALLQRLRGAMLKLPRASSLTGSGEPTLFGEQD